MAVKKDTESEEAKETGKRAGERKVARKVEEKEGWVTERAIEAEVTDKAGVEGVGLVWEAMATAEEKVAPKGRATEAVVGRGAEVQVEAKRG
ncbi:hypothetical protein AB1Y20_022584 [Prymnesium parvum]|uniref:Uncharacterized protein n=1 Tax=Prymnesium parvum TaxID=97485 RepID=A0AB34JHM1_PRYPA